MKVVYIDTETTGLNSTLLFHEIIEIAMIVEIHGYRIDEYHQKITPQNINRANEKALSINGYSEEAWQLSKPFENVAQQIQEIIHDADIVIGHNVKFDIEFLNEHFISLGMSPIRARQVDTITLAYEHLVPIGLKSLSMDSIRKFLNWDMKNSHTAMKDVEDVFKLWNTCSRMSKLKRMYLYFKRWNK